MHNTLEDSIEGQKRISGKLNTGRHGMDGPLGTPEK